MKHTNPITGDMIFDPPLTDEQMRELIRKSIANALEYPQPVPFSEPAAPRCEECDPSFTCFDGSAACRKPARCLQVAEEPARPPINPDEMTAHREALERFEDEISSKVAAALADSQVVSFVEVTGKVSF